MAKKRSIKTRVVTVTRKAGRRVAKAKIPLAVVLGFAPLVVSSVKEYQARPTMQAMVNHLSRAVLGYNPDNKIWAFWPHMYNGTIPILMGFGIHKLANFVGINRALSSAGVPLVRI